MRPTLFCCCNWWAQDAVQLLILFQYYYNNIYLKLDLKVGPVYQLDHLREKSSQDLAESMHAQGCNYGLGPVTVLFITMPNSNGSSVSSVFDETEGLNVVNSGFLFI